MAAAKPSADAMTPYQLPFPKEAAKEIVVGSAIPQDECLWVPQAENVWFRPLCLNVSTGYWMNLLRVRKSGVLSRHRHPQAVHGMVLKGRWRYLEHEWEATEGSYVFEPPGETHTLYVPEDVEEMITYFQVNGVMFYCDPYGNYTGYEDVFTKVDMCRKHFTAVGLGEDYVDQFVR
ncbi:2,4'-dihydroxyacetophenone dioxygenase family protein [Paraburkholderia tagetis]|uniref:2,4'-dihydroxyacetophenone dioxygenase family protein n=1 Tax=Paraburkholderia tagetis TaxID=2913261 RepID=A0A9X1ZYQ2_9BURK|nr:2,4'-dihydroxyacetophenone dioxygenase family protein [Paraburkholderia tagetis]MCG5078453.1 2,4'-dihydroxyacetophenone dioxygenase family protein [Paraburkholderia tagetis]